MFFSVKKNIKSARGNRPLPVKKNEKSVGKNWNIPAKAFLRIQFSKFFSDKTEKIEFQPQNAKKIKFTLQCKTCLIR